MVLPACDAGVVLCCGVWRAWAGAEAEVGVRGIHVVRVLVKLMPDWFPRQRRLFQALLFAWRSPGRLQRLQQEQELPLHMV